MLRLPYHWRKPEGVKKGLPKIRGLWYKMDCLAENLYIRASAMPPWGLYRGEVRRERITVSLTSFPARIHKVYYAVKSLMLQTVKADRILLWLADSQFPDRKLPERIQELVDRGLTICWCEDLRSHKKYHYALQQQQPDELVITYDDDIIYEQDSIEKLLQGHRMFPEAIICNRGHEITLNEQGRIAPYNTWKIHSPIGVEQPAHLILPSTGNGCLYPYGVMPPLTFDWELASGNALTADDIWMRFCSLSRGIKVLKTRQTIATLCNIMGSQKERLTQLNDIQGENQRVLDKLMTVFPELFSREWES